MSGARQDPNGWYLPASVEEWAALLEGSEVSWPSGCSFGWMQEAMPAELGAPIGYTQSPSGWSRR